MSMTLCHVLDSFGTGRALSLMKTRYVLHPGGEYLGDVAIPNSLIRFGIATPKDFLVEIANVHNNFGFLSEILSESGLFWISLSIFCTS